LAFIGLSKDYFFNILHKKLPEVILVLNPFFLNKQHLININKDTYFRVGIALTLID